MNLALGGRRHATSAPCRRKNTCLLFCAKVDQLVCTEVVFVVFQKEEERIGVWSRGHKLVEGGEDVSLGSLGGIACTMPLELVWLCLKTFVIMVEE